MFFLQCDNIGTKLLTVLENLSHRSEQLGPQLPWFVVQGDYRGWSFGRDRKTRGPLSQQLRYDNDYSQFKGHISAEQSSQYLADLRR